jgi:CTP:molybdopterin cytidylyltransferase MocA
VSERVAGILLAAGAGRRYGMPKALVPHRGGLFVENAAAVLAGGGCDPVIVVLGARAEEVRAKAALAPYTVVDSAEWAGGMGFSLRTGLSVLRRVAPDAVAVAVLPVDVPGVTAAAVRRVLAAAAPGVLARADYDGPPGHPVLIGRDHWAGVWESADGDAGARPYLKGRRVDLVPCGDIASGTDVDRPEDLPTG